MNGWQKSSYCGTNACVEVNMGDFRASSACTNGSCVEVAVEERRVRMRDSKETNGPELNFTRSEWLAFLDGAKAGEFDLPS